MREPNRILIIRHGAYGDIMHVSHLPRLLKDNGADYVGMSTGYKGIQLLKHNPFIDIFHYFELGDRKLTNAYFDGRLRVLGAMYDKVINLGSSLEEGALAMEHMNDYYQDDAWRKKRGERNYYDISTELAGYPELKGQYQGEIFYTPEEQKTVEYDLLRPGRFSSNFKIMINLAGSGPHKVFVQAKEIAQWVLDTYPDAIIFTTGAEIVKELDFEDMDDRVHSIVGKKPFRQALLMAKHMDCVIGCESGLMVGASLWDVPTIQLLTATSKLCHTKYATKDYSIQSPVRCSPCYKGPYKYYGCPKRNNSPTCVYFNIKDIKHNINRIYNEQYKKQPILSEVT